MKLDHSTVILFVIGLFLAFMIWGVVNNSPDSPTHRVLADLPAPQVDGLSVGA